MIVRKLTYLVIYFLLLMACTDRKVEIEVVVPLNSKVKFSVEVNEFAVRSQYPTQLLPEESRIFNYAVLIFDADEHLEAFLTASPYSPNVSGSEGIEYDGSLIFTDDNGNEIELNITAGKKFVYALINAPVPVLQWRNELLAEENATLSNFKTWVFDAGLYGGIDIITGRTAVPEGDERGFMMTTKDGVQVVYLEPTEDEPTTIGITVGRAMAKVSVHSLLNPLKKAEEQPHGELMDITYKVINNPSEMYLITNYEDQVLKTPYYDIHSDGPVDTDLYFESTGPLEDNYITISTLDEPTYLYCMENANRIPNDRNATMAIIKGVFVPNELYRADGVTPYTGYKKGDTFWRIAMMENGVRTSFLSEYYGEVPTAANLTINQVAVEYTGGETVYPVYLYNSENPTAPYTVKRNSYYNIELTKVNGAGEPVEDKIITPPGLYIEVNIKMMDWQGINQNGEI